MRNAILEKTVLLEKLEKSNLMLSTILEDYQENSLITKDNFKTINDAFSINQEYKNRLEWCRKSRKINFCKCVN